MGRNVVVQGDVLVKCFHSKKATLSGKHMVPMFHFTFNTDFFHDRSNLLRLPKAEVDEATALCQMKINAVRWKSLPTVERTWNQSVTALIFDMSSNCTCRQKATSEEARGIMILWQYDVVLAQIKRHPNRASIWQFK
ncbi:putative phosphatidylinositol-3,4,5-trisphosphate 3-phosphatase [Phytophthora cinnamomi]|uniref:putative phosphatidylinositol-3,4,5-trisphosphate 3-phosphatase n=1 Tax=Phytophthora cinnamomi TaxID=4785 RepID=UPI00355A7C38|nr:putative phosphatidylinositol-3,4,5-trisphosphate 3-phosphatase [Phytophthora cinnamomi]